MYTLGEIAQLTGAELDGDPGQLITGVATLQRAGGGEISFLANKRYVRHLQHTAAAAVILSAQDRHRCPVPALVCSNPYLAFARVMRHMQPDFSFTAGVHPSAITDERCTISPSAHIAANVVIGDAAKIGNRVYIGPGCVIGENVVVGDNTRLAANVTLCDGVHIGKNGILHPGVVIGADGFGIVKDQDAWLKIPQTASVLIADDVEIGANTTIDRGALEDTVVETGVKIDNQVQLGHGVKIGAHTAIAGCTGIAGSTVIGRRCMIGGQSGISGHLEIADDVIITAMSGVSNSIKKAGIYSSGIPVTETVKWRKNIARFRNLDDITRKLFRLARYSGHENDSE